MCVDVYACIYLFAFSLSLSHFLPPKGAPAPETTPFVQCLVIQSHWVCLSAAAAATVAASSVDDRHNRKTKTLREWASLILLLLAQ